MSRYRQSSDSGLVSAGEIHSAYKMVFEILQDKNDDYTSNSYAALKAISTRFSLPFESVEKIVNDGVVN